MNYKNSKTFSLLFLVSLFAFSTGCNNDDDSTPDASAEILPGQGISEIKLGDSGQAVFDAFGTVADSWASFGSQYFHQLIYLSKGLSFGLEANDSEMLDLSKKVTSITIQDPFSGKTTEGIGIGSTMVDVKAAFGEPDSEGTSFGAPEHTYDGKFVIEYDDQGNDTVVLITID